LLYRTVAWPPSAGVLQPRQVAHLPGVILEADAVPGGVLALVTNRVAGAGFDTSPRLLLVQGTRVSVLRLPRVSGDVLARSLETAWPSAIVRAADVTAFTHDAEGNVVWSTPDGGRTWSVVRN